MARKDNVVTLHENKPVPPHERRCDYCGAHSHGVVNGRAACGEHFLQALDGDKPMQEVKVRGDGG